MICLLTLRNSAWLRFELESTSFRETVSTSCTIFSSLFCFLISCSNSIITPVTSFISNRLAMLVGQSERDWLGGRAGGSDGRQAERSGPFFAHCASLSQRHQASPFPLPQFRRTSESALVRGHTIPCHSRSEHSADSGIFASGTDGIRLAKVEPKHKW